VPVSSLSIGIQLGSKLPIGTGYRLAFMDSWQGGVFATSEGFEIVGEGQGQSRIKNSQRRGEEREEEDGDRQASTLPRLGEVR
jgi:hypothetical protein